LRECCADSSTEEIVAALLEGARLELLLTPKPGLVDIYDNGSHKDLNFGKMCKSINLLEQYYAELITAMKRGTNLHEIRIIGQNAELRMKHTCGTNTHKGYIFLSGLLLVAGMSRDDVREGIKDIATVLFESTPVGTNGAKARKEHKVGGIIDESLKGFPAVFEDALPAYKQKMEETGNHQKAAVLAMARLMQTVEDTTALSRCGDDGLYKIKADGKQVERLINSGNSGFSYLRGLNDEYKQMNLTMGGVADMLALTFAVSRLV